MNYSNDVTGKESFFYALTNTGQTLIYAIFTTYFMQYMSDVLAIDLAAVGTLLLFLRIWDAVNDPVMGAIVDRTHTKWGKCRPYMLFTPIPVAIVCMLLFLPINFRGNQAIIYASISYLLFDFVYTMNDIPYWGMSAVITSNPEKRVKVVSMTRIIGGCGSAITTVAFMVVVSSFNNSNNLQMSYFLASVIFGIVGAALMLQGFFNTKERSVESSEQKEPFFGNLVEVMKTKPMLLNLVAGTLVSFVTIGTTALTTYYAKWNIWYAVYSGHDGFINWLNSIFNLSDPIRVQALFTPVLGVLPAIAMVIGLFITPFVVKKYSKRKVLITTCIVGGIMNIIFYFIGDNNLLIFVLGRFICCIPTGLWSGITTSMFGDSVDYVEWKTGRRTEGACFSLLTFVGKFAGGFSAFVIGQILGADSVNYNEDLGNKIDELKAAGNLAEAALLQQPTSALKAIFLLTTLIMGIGQILCVIPYFFYDFDNETHQKILEEINVRKEAVQASSDIASAE